MAKTISTIFYTIFIVLLFGIAALFLASLAPISLFGQALGGQAGNIELKIVKSGSMDPEIPVGALVIIKPAETYAAGDVITFGKDTASEIPTTHRIISVREEGGQTFYTTKGDANEEADSEEVAKSEVIGKVLFDVPYAGFVLDFARQPLGFALLIGLPAAFIILDEGWTIAREVAAMRKQKAPPTPSSAPLLRRREEEYRARKLVYKKTRPTDDILFPSVEERVIKHMLDLRRGIQI